MIQTSTNYQEQSPDVYDDGVFRLEYRNYYAEWNGKMLKLTRVEFLIMTQLTQKCGRLVQSTELWDLIWGAKKKYNPGSLRVYICRLRSIIEPLGMRIENMPDVGYRFIPHIGLTKTPPNLNL